MKKLVVISSIALAVLSSCVTQKMGTPTYNDDVYANPKEDRINDAQIAAAKKQAQEVVDKRYNDSIAAVKQAQKAKDDANPYYKDREFKYDDYYDYEYATRVKRFDKNINGLSYYDNYYTNSYFYNQNPYNYGVSVYNGYNWWGSSYNNYSYNPSVSFYNSWGWGYGNQFNSGYNGYNPYMSAYSQGYNNGFNNGMYGNYYGYGSPYGSSFGYGNYYGYGNQYGYGNYGNSYGGYGYNNPYSGGWGYYNSYDNNSSYSYGPRTSHGGGNSHRTSNPGLSGGRDDSYAHKYIETVNEQQTHVVKFNDVKNPRGIENDVPIRVNSNGTPIGTGGVKPVKENAPVRGVTDVNQPIINPVRTTDTPPVRHNPTITNEPIKNEPLNTTPRNETPVRQNPIIKVEPVRQPAETPRQEVPVRQNNNLQTPSTPINNGGSNNGGGGRRPR